MIPQYTDFILMGNVDRTEGRGATVEVFRSQRLSEAIGVNAGGKFGVQGSPNDCRVYMEKWFVDENGQRWSTKPELMFKRGWDWDKHKPEYIWVIDPNPYLEKENQ